MKDISKKPPKKVSNIDKFHFGDSGKVSTQNITEDGEIFFEWIYPNGSKLNREQMPLFPFCYFAKLIFDVPNLDLGVWQATHVAIAGFKLSGRTIQNEDEERVRYAIIGLCITLRQWTTLEDFLVEYNYVVLRNKRISYSEASAQTTIILGRVINKDALRMQVRKFAQNLGLPPVDIRRRVNPGS